MKLTILISTIVFSGSIFSSLGQDLPPLVHRAAEGVYYRQSEDEKKIIATTSWIEFRDFVVVVDANYPWGAGPILSDLRKTTNKPVRFVLDTHYHADHSYGNGVFAEQGATIISSDDTAADSRTRNTPSWEKNKDTGEFNLKQYRLVHPQLTFHDKLVIDDGERRLELIRVGPAHTRGDVVAWLPKERILFTGDVCTTRAQNNLSDPGMDPDGWVRVLGQLAQMNPAIVVPGHGIQGTVDALNGQRAYLSAMIEQVRRGVAHSETADQIFNAIDWKKYKPWSDEERRNRADITILYDKFKNR
jgi:glyoxylase-like metal-dependent hydrolase (beta-lactamase superfamily II)